MIRRAIICGAGGFVGGHIAATLAAQGLEVTALDRGFDAAAEARLADCTLLTADLGTEEADLAGADLVIHGAALTTPPAEAGMTEAEHVAANLDPLLTLLSAVERDMPGAFVFLSSSGVFDYGDGADGLRDDDPPTGRGAYAEAKRAGELLTLSGHFGPTAMHAVRLGHIFGPGERRRPSRTGLSLVARWLEAAAEGRPLEVPADDPARDWTWAPDLGPALLRIAGTAPAGRVLHLTSGAVRRDRQIAEAIAAHHPGARLVEAPPVHAKLPMAPSAIDSLAGFDWTSPEAGLARLLRAEATA